MSVYTLASLFCVLTGIRKRWMTGLIFIYMHSYTIIIHNLGRLLTSTRDPLVTQMRPIGTQHTNSKLEESQKQCSGSLVGSLGSLTGSL